MADFDLMRSLSQSAQTKIVLLVMDGLGGMPVEPGGPTELEAAARPNMNRLAAEGCLGQMNPVGYGITPGSGPGHLALFGYDPLKFDIGRGVLEAFGIGVHVGSDDVAARGNFCTVDAERQDHRPPRRAHRHRGLEAAGGEAGEDQTPRH